MKNGLNHTLVFESSPSIGVSLNFLTLGIELGTELSSFEVEFVSLGPMDVSIVSKSA